MNFIIDEKNAVQTYAYFSNLSGLKGVITENELPEMIKVWRKNGGVVIRQKSTNNIIILDAEKDKKAILSTDMSDEGDFDELV